MALWQYTFTIIPQQYILKDISNEGFEDQLFWEYANIHKEDFMQVNSFLPKTKSWSEYLDIYGNIDSNCLEVFFDRENRVTSVSLRIDFRSDYNKILYQLLSILDEKDYTLLDEKLQPVSLINNKCLEVIIKQSTQYEKYNKLAYLTNEK
ncbi:hypothetical protein [Capnocytophaga sp. oral taxon 878]|uniref:hypothetical protein n=1 Tax=Capnocytophaga sp. oral taxon 878 TaxID=1316596 RepID=UPI000D036705|nr:hypothetical protein [Capnocytophaga sp. oral taxon 878]AVM49696.1 hypothetical protein C4H12_04000 [Capnocytophaga sp. oral taxon 878]